MTEEVEKACPLCMEEMDVTDRQLKPCKCGYEVCVWCWHHIIEMAEKDGTEGRCPACRIPYDKERIVGMSISSVRLAELNAEKKQKLQKAKSKALESRTHLSTVRVIQRNLVYIAGLPLNLADLETLKKKKFLGQYGKVLKVATTKVTSANQHFLANNSCSVYVTFSKEGEAIRCIQVLNGFILDGRQLKACFGTTRYCNAWLRNMPCGNPGCLYLHDVGKQEDTCTKDEVNSVCTSKVQQSSGIVGNLRQCSGSFFPPPMDRFCSKTEVALGRPVVKPVVLHPVGYGKNKFPDGDNTKCGACSSPTSRGLSGSSGRSSFTSATDVRGQKSNKPCISGCSLSPTTSVDAEVPTPGQDTHQNSKQNVSLRNHLSPLHGGVGNCSPLKLWDTIDHLSSLSGCSPMPTTSVEAEVPTQGHDTYQSSKQNVSLRNHLAPLHDVVGNISSLKSCDRNDHLSSSVMPNIGLNFGTDPTAKELSYNSFSSLMPKRSVHVTYSVDSNHAGQPSISLPNGRNRCSTVNETRAGLMMNVHSLTDSINADSESFDVNSSYFPSAEYPLSYFLKDNHRSILENFTVGQVPSFSSSLRMGLPNEQHVACSDWRLMRSANDLGTNDRFLSKPGKLEDICNFHTENSSMGHEVDDFCLSSVSCSIPSKGEHQKSNSISSVYSEGIELQRVEHGHQIPRLEKNEIKDSGVCDRAKKNPRDDNIISDILSLDLDLGDPSVGSSLSKMLLCESNETVGCSKFFNTWKSGHSSESRFSFARMGELREATEQTISFNTKLCRQEENSYQLDVVEKNTVYPSGSLNHSTVTDKKISEVTSDSFPLPRFPVQNRALHTPPPGFYPQHGADQYPPFSVLSSPGSSVQYTCLGNSPHLNSTQQLARNNICFGAKHIDPAGMSFSRGKALSSRNLVSTNYSCTEMDQRLQFFKSRQYDSEPNCTSGRNQVEPLI